MEKLLHPLEEEHRWKDRWRRGEMSAYALFVAVACLVMGGWKAPLAAVDSAILYAPITSQFERDDLNKYRFSVGGKPVFIYSETRYEPGSIVPLFASSRYQTAFILEKVDDDIFARMLHILKRSWSSREYLSFYFAVIAFVAALVGIPSVVRLERQFKKEDGEA